MIRRPVAALEEVEVTAAPDRALAAADIALDFLEPFLESNYLAPRNDLDLAKCDGAGWEAWDWPAMVDSARMYWLRFLSLYYRQVVQQ